MNYVKESKKTEYPMARHSMACILFKISDVFDFSWHILINFRTTYVFENHVKINFLDEIEA